MHARLLEVNNLVKVINYLQAELRSVSTRHSINSETCGQVGAVEEHLVHTFKLGRLGTQCSPAHNNGAYNPEFGFRMKMKHFESV